MPEPVSAGMLEWAISVPALQAASGRLIVAATPTAATATRAMASPTAAILVMFLPSCRPDGGSMGTRRAAIEGLLYGRRNRTRKSDAPFLSGPDELVDLELKSRGQAVLQDPCGELRGVESLRDRVRRRHGREEDRPRVRRMLRQHGLREVVVLAVHDDELDLVVRAQEGEVRERLVGLHAGPGALDVHDVPHASRGPFPRQAHIERPQVDLAIRLEGVHERFRERADRAGDRLALEERLASGPTDVPDPSGRRFRRIGERPDARHDLGHRCAAEFAPFDGVHRVTPAAAEVARIEADEDCRETDEGALALDRRVQLAE